jgi:hypothetical protein
VTQQREHPAWPQHHLADHTQVGPEFVGETGVGFARACRTHGDVKRECQDFRVDRLRTADKIKPDLVVVMPEPVELQPEHVGRSCRGLLDGGTAGNAERIGNARALRRLCHQKIRARPDQ